MHTTWSPRYDVPESNLDEAAAPEAILLARPRKLPLWDNDPTRDIPESVSLADLVFLTLALAALAILAAATAMLLLRPS